MSNIMKDSGIEWIGQIPEDWKVSKLKSNFSFEKGKNAAQYTQEYIGENEGEYPVYSGQTENNGIMGKINSYDYDLKECVFSTTVGAKVMTPRYLQGKFSLSQNCLIMVQQTDYVCKLLYYVLLPLFSYEKTLIPTHMQPSLRFSDLKKYFLPLPSITEQQKIVDYLDKKCGKIDDVIDNQKQIIEKLKEYKQSVITETVTKGLNPNTPMKDSGIEWIGQIPQHWEVKKLKHIVAKIYKGSGITKDDIVQDGDISCVRYGEIYTKYKYHFDKCYTKTDISKVKAPSFFAYGDILSVTTGELIEEIGKSVVYLGNEKCLAGGDIVVMKHSQHPVFMGYAMDSEYIQSQKSFGKIKLKVVHISGYALKNLIVAKPPFSEQKEIADYLDKKCVEIDNAIGQKEETITKLEEYKKSLIYECVTGKREVA